MQSRQLRLDHHLYTRVHKAKARSLYSAGEEVFLHPVNIAICDYWKPCPIRKDGPFTVLNHWKFDEHVNSFTHYNCSHETGYYPAFYTETAMKNHRITEVQ